MDDTNLPSQPEGLGDLPLNLAQGVENIVQGTEDVIEHPINTAAAQVGDIQMVAIQSSDILAAGYDPIGYRAQIQFNNNRIYVFSNVSPLDWEGFMAAPSKGKYFWMWRRNPVQYPFVRIA